MNATYPAPTESVPAPEADTIQIGKDFYALSGNLPAGTDFHWGVNLKVLNQTETLAQVQHVQDSFNRAELKNVNLKYVEFGNEADFFGGLGQANPGWEEWSVGNYSTTWSAIAKSALGIVKQAKLVPGSFANFSPAYGALQFTALGAFLNNILGDKKVAKKVEEWSMHMYHGAFDPTVPIHVGTLMDKVNVHTNLSAKADDIRWVRSQNLGYFLSEGNSYAK